MEQDSRHLAEGAAARLRQLFPQWSIEPLAVGDSPAWGIITQATEWDADLIVVGSHGRTAMERLFLGSVSHKVAQEAPCSVHIARPRPVSSATQRILIAFDGSLDSLAAVSAVASRNWLSSGEFQLVTVLDSRILTAPAWPSPLTKPWVAPTDTSGQEWIVRAMESSARQLRSAGLAVQTHLLEGEPKHLLLKHAEAWQADCLFLGAHGLHHGLRRSLGSCASAVATRAHCSVELARERAPAGNPAEGAQQMEPSS